MWLLFLVTLVYTGIAHNDTICIPERSYGFIRYPIVDLFMCAEQVKKELPASAKNYTACPRVNQGLFNEVFEIDFYSSHVCSIIIPWAIYGYNAQGQPQNRYWIARKDLILLSDLPSNKLNLLPQFHNQEKIISIKQPFISSSGTIYSVGTCFVYTNQDKSSVTLKYLNSDTLAIEYQPIARDHCIFYDENSLVDRRRLFVQLITGLVDALQNNDIANTIPYVWGGSGFTRGYCAGYHNINGRFYRIDQKSTESIGGYDCSNLVLRFAHMANLPYFFKTTAMLEKYGKKFKATNVLEEGDLIWLEGHVAIITDLDNKLITESCGYENGVGKVRTIKLGEFLKDIQSWQDLLDAHFHSKKVIRLDVHGTAYKESLIKIFKLF